VILFNVVTIDIDVWSQGVYLLCICIHIFYFHSTMV